MAGGRGGEPSNYLARLSEWADAHLALIRGYIQYRPQASSQTCFQKTALVYGRSSDQEAGFATTRAQMAETSDKTLLDSLLKDYGVAIIAAKNSFFSNISTGMAIAGVILLAKSVKLTAKFTNALEIPSEFIEKNVKLRGRLHRITDQGFEIEHVPITLPIISSLQKRWHSDGLLLVRLAGVELVPGGTVWLKDEVKSSQMMWFQLLGRKDSVLHCLVVVSKGRFSSVCLNEEVLKQGLGKTVNIEGLAHESQIYWKLHKRLLQAELKAVKKHKGIWKEETFVEKLKEHITNNKYIQKLKQFATWLRIRL